MSRGGLREGNKSGQNHLFKKKWHLGKTTAIRIPEVLKDCLLAIAKELDNSGKLLDQDIKVSERITKYESVKTRMQNYKKRLLELRREKIKLLKENEKLVNQSKQENQFDKYKIAVKCFEEFLKSQSLDIEDLSKSKKGTKKHQLWEIKSWLEAQKK